MACLADIVLPASIETVETPCLLLDGRRMRHNIARLRERLQRAGVLLRPHLKTVKSIDVARLLMDGPKGPATVSTLREAEEFAAAGVRDILYAVGIAPGKLSRVLALRKSGVDLSIILDSLEQAHAVVAACREAKESIPTLVEIDCDGRRAGIRAGHPLLIEIGRLLHGGGAEVRGVMTHAGGSYDEPGAAAITAAAEQERLAVVQAAEALRRNDVPCPIVSVGSTPTAHFARDFSGITEVRAGVFAFFDLVMAGLGVCAVEDIAISVLASVIGHQQEKGWILVDAGWMAMSRDRGTATQAVDQGYGLVCGLDGQPFDDLIMSGANQEHGILAIREGSDAVLPRLPIGARVRILPNHACATAAQHDRYHLVDGDGGRISAIWPRFSGW